MLGILCSKYLNLYFYFVGFFFILQLTLVNPLFSCSLIFFHYLKYCTEYCVLVNISPKIVFPAINIL